MTKLFDEIKVLNLEDSVRLLTNVAHNDLVIEYKKLVDLADEKLSDDIKKMAVEVAKEVVKETLANDDKPKTERKCVSCDNMVFGRSKKCDDCKEPAELAAKEIQNA